jgi:hypothetical protein
LPGSFRVIFARWDIAKTPSIEAVASLVSNDLEQPSGKACRFPTGFDSLECVLCHIFGVGRTPHHGKRYRTRSPQICPDERFERISITLLGADYESRGVISCRRGLT